MIYLSFLLAFELSPFEEEENITDRVKNCYTPLFQLFQEEEGRFTASISALFLDIMVKYGHTELLQRIKSSFLMGDVEFVSTSAYDSLLPLLPHRIRESHILKNESEFFKFLKRDPNFLGFFPPGLAFGHEIVDVLKKREYVWTITDDQSFEAIHERVPWNYIPEMDDLLVFLRSSLWSNRIAFGVRNDGTSFTGEDIVNWWIYDLNKWWDGKDGYIVVVLPADTFGYHRRGYIDRFLVSMLNTIRQKSKDIEMVYVSQLLDIFDAAVEEVPPSSWGSDNEQFWRGNFYHLWYDRYDPLHNMWWDLVNTSLSIVKKPDDEMNQYLSMWLLEKIKEKKPLSLLKKAVNHFVNAAREEAERKTKKIRSKKKIKSKITHLEELRSKIIEILEGKLDLGKVAHENNQDVLVEMNLF